MNRKTPIVAFVAHGAVAWVERMLVPLDWMRAWGYRLAAPIAAPLYANRARRVIWLGSLLVIGAFCLTLLVPLWLLALGPVLLGVPHLLSDLRYLVVRPGLHRQPRLWAVAPLVLAVGVGGGPMVGVCAMLPAILAAGGARVRKGVLLGSWAVLTGIAFFSPMGFQRVFLHIHNIIAVILWWWWRPRCGVDWIVPGWVLLGSIALLGGAAEPMLNRFGGWTAPWTGQSFSDYVDQIAPLTDENLALRGVLLFCFLQAVHYSMWLRLIPEDDRPRPAPRPFRSSWRALLEDFGTWPLFLVGGLAILVVGWAVVDLPGARLSYLQVAAGHGYLEIAAMTYFFANERRALQRF